MTPREALTLARRHLKKGEPLPSDIEMTLEAAGYDVAKLERKYAHG